MKIKTRFAPSPTGMLHIGNARTALINYLFAKHYGGEFILRIDDTDLARSTKEFEEFIKKDIKWLGFEWNEIFWQSERFEKYEKAKNFLIEKNRLYECYETPEELELKRKFQLSSGKPPIYDRASLNLSEAQKEKYREAGRKPHYRFKLEGDHIKWADLVKGEIQFEAYNLSDPILIREDGSMTYMICSTIDDIEMEISHVIRGEDHISNTAVQIQLFEAFGRDHPNFGHISLVKAKSEKISKRLGGFEINSLREDKFIEAMTINSFFANIGTSNQVQPYKNLEELARNFDINKFSKSPTTYIAEELEQLNHKYLLTLSYEEAKPRLKELGLDSMEKNFWETIKPNINTMKDAKLWWEICNNFSPSLVPVEDKEFLMVAKNLLPDAEITENSWKEWTEQIKRESGRSGKNLYMPLRYAITGLREGPELSYLLPLIGNKEIIRRLEISIG